MYTSKDNHDKTLLKREKVQPEHENAHTAKASSH